MPDLDALKASPLAGLILGAALSRMAGDADAPDKPARPVEQDVATLLAAADRYLTPAGFEPRQLVTPRADAEIAGAGRPHVVLHVLDRAYPTMVASEPKHLTSSGYGRRLDMRVAEVCGCPHGEIRAFWVESWMFEPWTAPALAEAAALPAEPSPEPVTA